MTIPIKPIIMIIIVTIMIITAIITHINVSLSLYTWWYLMFLIFRLYIYICMLAPPKDPPVWVIFMCRLEPSFGKKNASFQNDMTLW